jgi:hypothetical protein
MNLFEFINRRSTRLQERWRQRKSQWSVDVVIPCIEKDLAVLGWAVHGVRSRLRHPISQIWVIGPDRPAIRKAVVDLQCQWVDENRVTGFAKEDLDYFPGGLDRRGWLFQQFLKLHADSVGSAPYILLLDADTVFTQPVSFECEGKLTVHSETSLHEPYLESLSRLLPDLSRPTVSYVCNYCFLPRVTLGELRSHLGGDHFRETILSSLAEGALSGFSEYELIGNWLVQKTGGCLVCPSGNLGVSQAAWSRAWFRLAMSWLVRSVSMHEYNEPRRSLEEA